MGPVIMNTLSLLVLSGLTLFACDAQQLRGSASSENVTIDLGNSTNMNVTLGSTSGSCDTSSWDSHFSSDTKACGMRSGGRQPAAGQCANCIGDYISCSREHCTMACCLGNCVDAYNCKKCNSDHCTWGLKQCTGGFVPNGNWVR